jgi:hypothetical protein
MNNTFADSSKIIKMFSPEKDISPQGGSLLFSRRKALFLDDDEKGFSIWQGAAGASGSVADMAGHGGSQGMVCAELFIFWLDGCPGGYPFPKTIHSRAGTPTLP